MRREIGPSFVCYHCGLQAWILHPIKHPPELTELECAVCGSVTGIAIQWTAFFPDYLISATCTDALPVAPPGPPSEPSELP